MRAFFANTILFIKRAKVALFGVNPLTGIKLTFFVAAIALGVLAIAHPVLAGPEGSIGGDIADWLVTGVTDILLVTARLAIGICIFFLHLFITLASYNNYINTPVVQVGWIMVRDVANMFFVVTLLVIAFGTILGLEQYEWKKGLVKLILGAIFINFSNLLAQLIIDVAHVFTITFLNAIAAAAGGNLLQMFHLTEILSFVQKPKSTDVSNVRLELLGGAIMAVIFAIFSAVAMGAYVVAMMARVVLLWVLIIMSPLAFIWQVLPATQGYAERWWKEFKEQVLVAPIMVFFLWLTFATLGTGTVIRDIQDGEGGKSNVIPLQNEASDEVAVSISKVSSWERMASFLVAIAFLFIGIKEVGETGAVGSRIIGSAVDFGKKVATVATGYAAGKWLVGKGADAAKATAMAPIKATGWLAKKGAWHVAGKHIVNKAKTTKAAYLDWYYKQGNKMTDKGYEMRADAGKKTEELVKKKDLAAKTTDQTEKVKLELEATELESQIADLEQKMQKEFAGGIFGSSARRGIQFEKQLAKTEKQMDYSKKQLWKNVGSEAGGKVLFGMGVGTGTRGIGLVPFQGMAEKALDKSAAKKKEEIASVDKELEGLQASRAEKLKKNDVEGMNADDAKIAGLTQKRNKLEKQMGRRQWLGKKVKFARLMGDQFELDEDLAKKVYGEKGITAKDRVERGWYKAEEARSAAKDEEFESLGEHQALYRPRLKYDVKQGRIGWQAVKGGIADQEAQHKVGAETWQEGTKAIKTQARMKVVAEFDARTKQMDNLDTKEKEVKQNLLAAQSVSEFSLEKKAAELRGRIGGIDAEREEREGALEKANKDAEKKTAERAKEIKTLDETIASAGEESEDGKKAKARKEILEAEAVKDKEKIDAITKHIADLEKEKKTILGDGDNEPGTLALLEAELKDIEAIIAGGDDKITERLGEIDGTIAAEKDTLKTAGAGVGDLTKRREKAEAELEAARTKNKDTAGIIQKKIDELEEEVKKGGNAGRLAERQLKGEALVDIILDGKKTSVQTDLYRYAKGGKNQEVAQKEKEVEKLKKDEAAAKQTADDKAKASRSNLEKQERMKDALEKGKKKDPNWATRYDAEIGGLRDRRDGVGTGLEIEAKIAELKQKGDPKSKEDIKKLEERLAVIKKPRTELEGLEKQLAFVLGGDPRQIKAQIEELKKKDDPESNTKREKLEKQLAKIENPDKAEKAERAKRLEQVRAETSAPVQAQLAQVKAQKADLKKKATKLPSGVTYDEFLHNKSRAGFMAHILEQDEDRLFHAFETKEFSAALELDEAAKEVTRGKFDPKSKKLEEEKKALQAQFDERRSKGTVGTLDQQRLALEKQRKEATEELSNIERPLKQIESEIKKLDEAMKKIGDDLENKKDIDPDKRQEMEEFLKKLQGEKDGKVADLAKVQGGTPEEQAKVAARREELATTIKAKDDEIIGVRNKIKVAETDMRKTDPAYVRLERQLREKNKEIKEAQDENWKKKGERLRSGDKSVVAEVIKDIERQLGEATKAGDAQEIQRLGKERSKWETLGHHLKDASLAWSFGVSKAKQEDVAKGYKYKNNLLLSESEQRSVYDDRGLDTPKTTLTELIEQYGKSFGEMSIDSFVSNVGPMLTSMLEKKKAGTLTAQDKAALMGLFKRGLDRSWLDDAIYAISGDAKAKTMIADELGWEDNVYTDDKIRDIQMLFATADVDFVKKNAVMSYFQDVARNDFDDMKQEDTFEGIKTGVFKDKTGKNITAEFKAKMVSQMEANHFKPTKDQEELFKSIFASLETSDQSQLDEMQKSRTKALNEYLEATRQNQSEFQFLGNLRTDALKNGHVENAGYALAREIGGGESLYMGMGIRTARGHVMGDARKMDLRNRAGMQSHSFGYLDENNGQVMTDIHEDKYADLMNGIDPRTYNAVNPRARVHMMGLSSSDKFGNYRDEKDNSFHVSRMVNKDGTLTNAAKTWSTVLAKDDTYSKDWNGAKTREDQEKVMAAAQMNRIFAPQMRGNVSSFVMLAAEAAGLNPTSAAMDGKINFKIFNPAANGGKGANVAYKSINELISAYNKGDWNLGGKMPPKLIPSFVETDPASRKATKDIMEDTT